MFQLKTPPPILAVLGLLWSTAPGLQAQNGLSENFDNLSTNQSGQHGPPELIAAGWSFRNQSEPASSGDWVRWAYSYQGRWGLHVDRTAGRWEDDKSEVSTWAVLPAVPGQTAGDEVRFFASATPTSIFNSVPPTARLEIRYSPSGGTSTGSKADDVGDFTTLLADIPDPANPTFAEFRTGLPGNGRIALRFRVPPTANSSEFWGDFHIDNLRVGSAVTGPALPDPGDTVIWTEAMSPIAINELTTIPAGGTVVADPGVVIDLAPTATLTVHGSLVANGLPGQPVVLRGADSIDVFGTLDLDWADVTVRIEAKDSSATICRNVSFGSTSAISTSGSTTLPPFLDIDLCSFAGSSLRVGSCALRLTNSAFDSTYVEVGGCNQVLDNLTIDNAPQGGLNLHTFQQPVWLDNLTITNSAGAGLDLAALNALVGPNVVLTGNQYPADIGGAGFLPGSNLPSAGNLDNYVNVQNKSVGLIGGNPWADVSIPYVIADTYTAGLLDILPGAHIQLGPLATIWGVNAPVHARGTVAEPILFERFDPTQPWQGLQKFHRFESCIIDGGQIGARFNSTSFPGFIDDCIIRNCDFGTQNDVRVRKTRFVNNDVASWGDNIPDALDGAAGANSFVGNAVAIDPQGRIIEAQNNWWNSPTGPTAANNPGGTGEVILGSGAQVTPFLTSAPDFDDHPPRVYLQRHSGLMEPNSKVLLHWSSQDDVGVVAHRIEFEHPLEAGAITVLASGLPGTQRSYEWTVPDLGFIVNGTLPRIRVVATDTAGQEGWDASDHLIPSNEVGGTLVITSNLAGPFTAGSNQAPQVCWDASGLTGPVGQFTASLLLEADKTRVPLGGSFQSCLPGSGLGLPFVSTDTARLQIAVQGTTNRVKYFFSEPFAIRPDARLGDAPPSVTLLRPRSGESFAGGSVVPISWAASDDEGLRSFSIQATYDGGHTWHFLVEGLPGTTTQYAWRLPSSTGIPDVRIRVIAFDRRFQNTSDGADHVFAINADRELCQRDLEFGGPHGPRLRLCGQDLRRPGGVATLELTGAAPNALVIPVLGETIAPTELLGGMLVPGTPRLVLEPRRTDGSGKLRVPFSGGADEVATLYMQALVVSGTRTELTNALEVRAGH